MVRTTRLQGQDAPSLCPRESRVCTGPWSKEECPSLLGIRARAVRTEESSNLIIKRTYRNPSLIVRPRRPRDKCQQNHTSVPPQGSQRNEGLVLGESQRSGKTPAHSDVKLRTRSENGLTINENAGCQLTFHQFHGWEKQERYDPTG